MGIVFAPGHPSSQLKYGRCRHNLVAWAQVQWVQQGAGGMLLDLLPAPDGGGNECDEVTTAAGKESKKTVLALCRCKHPGGKQDKKKKDEHFLCLLPGNWNHDGYGGMIDER